MESLDQVLGSDHILYEILENGWRATKHTRIGVFCATAPTMQQALAAVMAQIRSRLALDPV